MVGKKLSVLVFLLVFASMSFVLAADDFKFHPNVDLKANPDEIYIVRISDALTAQGIKSIIFEIGPDGRENEKIGTDVEMVNIIILAIRNRSLFLKPENIISEKNAGTFATNNVISLNMRDNIFNALTFEEETTEEEEETEEEVEEETTEEEEETEEEVEEETTEEEEEEEDESGMTGNVVSNLVEFSKSYIIYFIVGLIIIGGVVGFFMIKKRYDFGSSLSSGHDEPRVVKLSELRGQSHDNRLGSAEKKLEKAGQELKDAREQISKIKNEKTELSEAEEEFQKAKEKLNKLKDNNGDD